MQKHANLTFGVRAHFVEIDRASVCGANQAKGAFSHARKVQQTIDQKSALTPNFAGNVL
jgi:hypothetical protein